MQPEKAMTDTERGQLAQIADLKAAKSLAQSAATIARLTKELATTREELKIANEARMLLSNELDRIREQIVALKSSEKLVTKATNHPDKARLSW